MKKGFRTLRDVDEPCRFFFVPDDQIAYDPQAVEKVLKKNNNEGITVLRDLREVFAAQTDWRHDTLETAVKLYGEQKQLGLGKVAQPIRVAISGTTVSPPIFESLEFLGKERTLRRMEGCIAAS
jgi:glutamyl-tRNA synthetase